jgi:RNA-directed DNA polymerase
MNAQAIIWTEGKTDWQHLRRAFDALKVDSQIEFREFDSDFGDDQLLKQCIALARVAQQLPTIFIFDRDKENIVSRVDDVATGYKSWGNNVYSFAIPVPPHRKEQSAICIELYYTDDALQTADAAGRRLYLSTEFNSNSGRHLTDPNLSVGNKGKLLSGRTAAVRIIDSEVYDPQSENVALSKADFAKNVHEGTDAFANFDFDAFGLIAEIVDRIIDAESGACE